MSGNRASRFLHRLTWQDLDPQPLRTLIEAARAEDLRGVGLLHPPPITGDLSTQLLQCVARTAEATLVARVPMVICGLPLGQMILDAYGADCQFEPLIADGQKAASGTPVALVRGQSGTLLSAERVILNFLQRLSGIATLTRRYVDALGNSPTRLLDTRKTTPGHRLLEKVATATGGGYNHRLGLYDRIMLKDNHLAADNARYGIALADLVRRAQQRFPGVAIELEIDAIEQIPPAIDAGVDILLLDNFDDAQLAAAVGLIGGAAVTEASGSITMERLPRLAGLGLDFISTGATIHHATWVDIGLDWIIAPH